MATINLLTLKKELMKIGLKTNKSTTSEYVDVPTTGTKVTLFLPEKYKAKDRPALLQKLASNLTIYGAKFEYGGNKPKSSAGWVCFNNSKIYIVAKIAGKVNKGISFEHNLENDLNNLKNGIEAYNHPDFIEDFQKNYLKDSTIVEIKNTGKKNTPRPLKMVGNQIYASLRGGSKTYDIGEGVADLIVETTSQGKKFNLSLKYGSTVTFFNSGIKTIMPEQDFRKGSFDDPMAQALLNLFSIDVQKFIGVFTGYSGETLGGKKIKAVKDSEVVSVDVDKLQEFIKTVIGKGYLLVHLDNQKKVHITEMNDAFLEVASRPLGNKITVKYPVGGSAKRVDMEVETQKFKLTFNIRNKQGGVFPSHIMCDYQMK